MITTRSHACYAPARRAAVPSGVPAQRWPAFLPRFGVGAGEPFMPVIVRAPNDGPSDPNPPEPKPSEPRPTAPRPANDDDADAVREVPLAVPFTGHDRPAHGGSTRRDGASHDDAPRFADPLDAPFVPPERYVVSLKLYERKHRRIIRPRTRDRVRDPKDGHFTVYAILDPVTGEAVYVGQTGTFDQRERRPSLTGSATSVLVQGRRSPTGWQRSGARRSFGCRRCRSNAGRSWCRSAAS